MRRQCDIHHACPPPPRAPLPQATAHEESEAESDAEDDVPSWYSEVYGQRWRAYQQVRCGLGGREGRMPRGG